MTVPTAQINSRMSSAADTQVHHRIEAVANKAQKSAEKASREAAEKAAQQAAGRIIDREIEIRLQMLRAPTPPTADPSHRERQGVHQKQAIRIDNDGKAHVKTINS
ncbi:hypothetical protein ACODM8_08090 [Vibrio ostreicida]|uniref:hypothetical protein n=1 Tax=Vibrio ostreicida TaxID=526588 RepID=UPI003B5C0E32